MDVGQNWETAFLATNGGTSLVALLKAFWKDYKLGQKFEKILMRIESVEDRMNAHVKVLDVRLNGHDEEIEAHALYDAQNYAPRTEFAVMISRLDSKIDTKFDILNSNIITAIRDGNGRNNN
jgi:hypothetical protein